MRNSAGKRKMTASTKSKIKLGINIATYVLIAFVLFLAVVFLSVSITSRDRSQIPSIFGASVLTVESDSMKPVFKEGDLIRVRKLSMEQVRNLKIGDIITFHDENLAADPNKKTIFNTHRITAFVVTGNVRLEEGEDLAGRDIIGFKTKGDNNPSEDTDTVSIGNVEARYVRRMSGLGNFVNFLTSTAGFFTIIMLPLILFFGYRFYILIMVITDLRKEKKEALEPSKPEDYDNLLKELEELRAKVENTERKPQDE